jgi:hypothetical protein
MSLSKQHADTKRTRGRGDTVPGHLATLNLLRKLEGELERVRLELATAWVGIDAARDFRKCSRHADAAQQRLHKTIKKLVGLKKRKSYIVMGSTITCTLDFHDKVETCQGEAAKITGGRT